MPTSSTIRGAAVIALVLSAGCSTLTGQARRDARLRAELDVHRFQQPLRVVWPAALRLLVDQHHQLVGHDRLLVGLPRESRWSRITHGGFETARLRDHGLVLETSEDGSRLRYRVEGVETDSGGSQVTFTAVRRTGNAPGQERSRDLEMELELVRRLEPEVAARLARDAESAGR